MTYEDALAAARRGAALLDDKEPRWRERVRLATLDLTDDCHCILGQVFGEYLQGSMTLHGKPMKSWLRLSRDWRHGFVAERGYDYPLLNRAWREVLAS